jgi:signal transduction histidine kinase
VSVYGEETFDYVLPWEQSGGRPTSCGPFKINVAYVQGAQRQSRIPPEYHSRLMSKLDLIGGVYIYRDGIRILPYGDADVDFLEIEKRRTKSARYYYFSYRRMFGVIRISREKNPSLEEKAGREGFQENKAFRQFRDILENFFVQLAADFFREGGERAEFWSKHRSLLERRDRARKEAEKRGRIERRKFGRELDGKFAKINRGDPLAEVDGVINSVENEIENLERKRQLDLFGIGLSRIEAKAFEYLRNIRIAYQLDRPMGVGLTPDLNRDWMVYSGELEALESEVFIPAENRVRELISDAAERMKTKVDRQHRIEQLVEGTTDSALSSVRSNINDTRVVLNNIGNKINKLLEGLYEEILDEAQRIKHEISELNIDGMKPSEIERFRRIKENEIIETELRINLVMEYIRAQLQEIDWVRVDGDYIISGAEMRAALEEELLALRKKSDADLQLTQLGMAIEIINHEFNQTIRSIRSDLQSMKKWADANPKLDDLYRSVRANFEHLDGYLNLLTPLHRRLYRSAVEIKGLSIYNFIDDLFRERLGDNKIQLEQTESFKEKSIVGYPSSFYPVFINLVDNSIYWLRDVRGPREIHFDADENGFIVWDTGPGIQTRDREAVFEMGFTRKPGGRGLGLYISREVLNREGFDLILDRASDDRGALFRIVPLAK